MSSHKPGPVKSEYIAQCVCRCATLTNKSYDSTFILKISLSFKFELILFSKRPSEGQLQIIKTYKS